MILTDDGKQIKELLNITMSLDNEGKPIINWDYGDKDNAYFLLGVLDVIKNDLIREIDKDYVEGD